MSSAGRAASISDCVVRPRARAIGLIGFAVQTQRSSLTGSYVMETAEHREPCESRGSRTVLGARGGEIPPRDSTNPVSLEVSRASPQHLRNPKSTAQVATSASGQKQSYENVLGYRVAHQGRSGPFQARKDRASHHPVLVALRQEAQLFGDMGDTLAVACLGERVRDVGAPMATLRTVGVE